MSAVVVPITAARRRRPAPEVDRYDLRDIRAALLDSLESIRALRDHLQRFEPGDFEHTIIVRALVLQNAECARLVGMIDRREKLRLVRG